jgi:hypothetical protein
LQGRCGWFNRKDDGGRHHADPTAERAARRLFWPGGLSARLLVLTVVFAALGGTVAIPPALAAYEKQWLLDRVRAAELASLAAEVAPDRVVSEQLKNQLLAGAGVEIVAVSDDGVRRWCSPRPARRRRPTGGPAQHARRAWPVRPVPDPAGRRRPGPRDGRAAVPPAPTSSSSSPPTPS